MAGTANNVRVRGVTYSSPDQARVAADELEHHGESVAENLRRSGKEGEADQVVDRAHADAARLRAWAREVEEGEAAATEQPPDRPAGSRRRTRGSRSGRRSPSTSSKGGTGEAAVAGSLGGLAGELAGDARRVPVAGNAATSITDLAWTVVGGIIGLSLVYALTNEKGHGPAAVEGIAGATSRSLRRFLDPHDPFLLGHSASDTNADTPAAAAPASTAAAGMTRITGGPAGIPGAGGALQPAAPSGPNTWAGAGGGTMPMLRRLARTFSLSVTNVYTPGVDSASGYHPEHRAIDVQPDARFKHFANTFALHHSSVFAELWGPGLGFYIKNGQVHAGDFPDTGTGPHGHIAI